MRVRFIVLVIALATVPAASFSEETRELRPFKPEGGRCSFATVGGRKPATAGYQRGEGDAEAKGRVFCFDQSACRCQVRYVDFPESAKGLSHLQFATRYGLQSWSEPGKLQKVGPAKAGEQYQGEEFAVTGLPKDWTCQVRVFVTGNRAYFVSAFYSKEKKAAAEPQAKAFLDSFQIADK